MHVQALWRYPIKSLTGEQLDSVDLTDEGVPGDRVVHVRNPRGLLTGRTRTGLLSLAGTTGPDGVPRVAGHVWDTDAAQELIRERAGADAELAAYAGPERFDILNLLVATDGSVERFGHDVRRLRPNILVGGVDRDAERDWPGHAVVMGEAVIGVHSVRQRCIVTTIDPDTGEQDLDVLRGIRREFGGELALNCWVIRRGRIRVGDPVHLVPTDAMPEQMGGWVVGAPYPA